MFNAAFFFLGVAAFILAAAVCLSKAKRAGKHVEVDIAAFQAASICLSAGTQAAADGTTATCDQEPTWDERANWREMKKMWMQWYAQCQEKTISRQKAIYSWVRTLALCAALCLVGILLEATFDKPITVDQLLAGFKHSHPVASYQTSHSQGRAVRAMSHPSS